MSTAVLVPRDNQQATPEPTGEPAPDRLRAAALFFDACALLVPVFDGAGTVADFAVAAAAGRDADILGLNWASVTGRELNAVLDTGTHARLRDAALRVHATAIPAELEWSSDAGGAWTELQLAPWDGGVLLAMRDVTTRRLAEESLRLSEARFRSLVHNSSDFMLVIRADGTLDYASPSVQRLLGYADDAYTGKSPLEFVHPDDRDLVAGRLGMLLRGTHPGDTAEYRVRHRDGHWVWFESIATNMLHDPAVRAIVVNARDITARKEAEEAVRRSEERLRLALDAAGMAIWDWNFTTNQFVRSERMAELYGLPPGALDDPAVDPLARVHPDDRPLIDEMDRRHIEDGAPYDVTYRVPFPDGTTHWLRERGHLLLESGGAQRRLIGVTSDITALKRADEQVREAEARFRTLVEQIPAVTYIATRTPGTHALRKIYVSPQIEELLGYTAAEWLSDPYLFLTAVHPEDVGRLEAADARANRTGRFRCEFRLRGRKGQDVWVRDQSSRVSSDPDGGELWQGVIFDVTEEKRAEQAMRFHAGLLNQVEAAVIGTDQHRVVTIWNRFAETLYGWKSAEAIGRPVTDLIVPAGTTPALPIDGQGSGEHLARRKDGALIPVHFSVAPIVNRHGETTGYVGVAVDVSERKQFEERLAEIAYRDPVTGLANRPRLMDDLQAALRGASASAPVALLFLDLDRFKVVNDSLGHDAGARLLKQVGDRLATCVRPQDVIARFGGDEFAIVCAGLTGTDQAADIADRVLASLTEPFDLDGRQAFIGGSVGIAIAGGPQIDAGELTRRADVAMYEAKAAGRGRLAVYDERANERAVRRLAHETDLRRAVEHGEFELHYQPVVDLSNGAITAFEALLRWRHPEHGLLSPNDFLAMADESGLIVPLGEWVLAEAARRAARWHELRPGDPPVVNVNVMPRQFREPGFARHLDRVLAESGLPPTSLTIEVTEESLAEDADAAERLMAAIKASGARLALDDFGAGYSSLSRLQRLPLDVVKIDRSFAAGLGSDRASEAIVRAIAVLANDLGLTVVAEGIETTEQCRIARELGCALGQGFVFARPMPADRVADLLSAPAVHHRGLPAA